MFYDDTVKIVNDWCDQAVCQIQTQKVTGSFKMRHQVTYQTLQGCRSDLTMLQPHVRNSGRGFVLFVVVEKI